MNLKSSMLLAGDIGGTKTLLGLFEPTGTRPRVVNVRDFTTLDFPDLAAIIAEFTSALEARRVPIDRACFGVAGPVLGNTAVLTNVPWRVDASQLAARFKIARVVLLNDLEAMANAVSVLDAAEVHVLQAGEAVREGNIGIIAAGTGLGIAMLHRVNGKLVPAASEGGHADFAVRNEREIAV